MMIAQTEAEVKGRDKKPQTVKKAAIFKEALIKCVCGAL